MLKIELITPQKKIVEKASEVLKIGILEGIIF